jgi:hypothetical protein
VFATLRNTGPAFGNINYDCNSETIRVVSHEDCRIYQLDMSGDVVSSFSHGLGDVTIGDANDPGEPDGLSCPLGQRMWAVQSHYGRIYYSVWWEDSGRSNANEANEIWSVAIDENGIPDPATDQLEATMPALLGTHSNPVSDLSFAATGWMLVSERTDLRAAAGQRHLGQRRQHLPGRRPGDPQQRRGWRRSRLSCGWLCVDDGRRARLLLTQCRVRRARHTVRWWWRGDQHAHRSRQ